MIIHTAGHCADTLIYSAELNGARKHHTFTRQLFVPDWFQLTAKCLCQGWILVLKNNDNKWIMRRSLVKKNKHRNKRRKLLIPIWLWISVSFLADFLIPRRNLAFSICTAEEAISTYSIPLVVLRNVWCLYNTWEACLFSSSFYFSNKSCTQPCLQSRIFEHLLAVIPNT